MEEKAQHNDEISFLSDFPHINPLPNAEACLVICFRNFSSFFSHNAQKLAVLLLITALVTLLAVKIQH